MKTIENILIVSFAKLDSIVIETLENKTGRKCTELHKYATPPRVSGVRRHLDYIVLALRVIALKNKYGTVIFWQQFIGLYFNFFCYLLLIGKHPQTIILTVIYKRRFSFLGKVFHSFFKLAFRSKYIDQLVCHSSNERRYYLEEFGSDLDNKVVFCRLGEGLQFKDCLPIQEDQYFFSGGSSNRDYGTLIKAFEGGDQKLIIACKPENINVKVIPPNVTILYDAYGISFSNLIKNAYAVILPIQDPNISSGQLVLLNAMRFGKCSIVTAGNCMADYLNENYAISVPAKSVDELRAAVAFLSTNPEKLRMMSVNAYSDYNSYYSIDKYAERIAELTRR
jgi:glycosyltransferase involved in cell wall biosynthesis